MHMISLEDNRWKELRHAYGAAFNVPAWLALIACGDLESDPWGWLRSTLCHQMAVYEAAYAAVPHLMHLGSIAPAGERRAFIELTAHIEGCRQLDLNGVAPIPSDLESDYFAALARLPSLVAESAEVDWDAETALVYAGALLIVKGHAHLGMTVTELTPRIRCTNCGEDFDYLPY